MPGSGCGEEPGRHYSPGGLPRSPGVTSGPRSNSSRSPAVSSGPWSKSTCPGRSSSDGVMVRGDAWQAGGSTQRTPIEAGRPGNKGSLLERAGMWQQQQARSLALERPWPAEDIPRGSRSPAATEGGVLTSTPWEATVTGEEAVRCSSNSRSPWAAEDPPRCNSRSLGASDGGALRSSGSWSTTEVEEPPRRTTSRYPWGATEGGGGALRSRPPSSTTSCSHKLLLASFLLLASCLAPAECGNPDAKRLYDDLLSNYNKLVRPVVNVTDVLTVMIKLKLSQLIDVNLKNQIMTTNLWVEQYWYDYKLIWDPAEYGGVKMLHVPSDHIWRPDIVLYNNADGNFEVTLSTKATLHMNGLVEWKPPAIYKSSCEIDVEYFPFDEQTCVMKFGSWTYDGFQVDLRHLDEKEGTNVVELGVDLSEFYMSVEWDILEVPAVRHEKFYTCCDEPYLDITFNITMRRKTLFYTVNLIIPCMGISFLTVLTFYLPSDSGEKVTLSISILISLHVFFLLVVEIIPPTSLVVPLLGKYLIFAMILVSISICVTVLVLNVHFRSPQTHKMAPWVKRVFIHILPRLLIMKRPQYQLNKHSSLKSEFKSVFMEPNRVMIRTCNGHEVQDSFYRPQFDDLMYKHNDHPLPYDTPLPRGPRNDFSPDAPCCRMTDGPFSTTCRIHGASNIHDDTYTLENSDKSPTFRPFQHNLPHCSPEVHRTCWCVNFIAEHTRLKEDSTKVKEDWKYVAMVLDRLFLWIFTLAVLVGTAGIILQAPSLYDDRTPLDKEISDVYRATHRLQV